MNYIASSVDHATASSSRNLVTSSGHVGKTFLTAPPKQTQTSTSSRNLVTSSGHVGKTFLTAPPTQTQTTSTNPISKTSSKTYYRGIALNPATTAAATMLSKGTVDIRFGIHGEAQEIVDLLTTAGTPLPLEQVQQWNKSGGAECCIVADQDDVVVAVCQCTGIRSSDNIAAFKYLTLPGVSTTNNAVGDRFLTKSIKICQGWGISVIQLHVPTTDTALMEYLKAYVERCQPEMAVVESYDASLGDCICLTLRKK